MARPSKHECTHHQIRLCPEIKSILLMKRAEMYVTKGSINYTMVIEEIVSEWDEMRRKTK